MQAHFILAMPTKPEHRATKYTSPQRISYVCFQLYKLPECLYNLLTVQPVVLIPQPIFHQYTILEDY